MRHTNPKKARNSYYFEQYKCTIQDGSFPKIPCGWALCTSILKEIISCSVLESRNIAKYNKNSIFIPITIERTRFRVFYFGLVFPVFRARPIANSPGRWYNIIYGI
ncbi:MAG TPA: hypothetical protein DEB31_00410 [Clostridiales bacterium]|nr:hypothetical protein [Clostridiales bacterium]